MKWNSKSSSSILRSDGVHTNCRGRQMVARRAALSWTDSNHFLSADLLD
jgi:hypothetical protein